MSTVPICSLSLEKVRRFNLWVGQLLAPYIGDRVLEIGAGIGTLTNQFIPREFYLATDTNRSHLRYLRAYSAAKPYFRVRNIDPGNPGDFAGLEGRFDTALMVDGLENVPDEDVALRNLRSSLMPGGRAVILVPQHPALYGTVDRCVRTPRNDIQESPCRRAWNEPAFR